MTTTTQEPLQRQSPIVTGEVMKQLVLRGLIGVPAAKTVGQRPFFPNLNSSKRIEAVKETVLAVLQEVGEPINRMKLIRLALKRNCLPVADPVEVCHVAIRHLRRERKLVIDRSKGCRVEYHLVSLA